MTTNRVQHRLSSILVNKVHRFSNTKKWVGYLTPTEIQQILDGGGKATSDCYVDDIKDMKNKGKNNPTWFYFYPTKEQLYTFMNK